MSTALTAPQATMDVLPEDIEQVLVGGDLGKLNATQRITYVNSICKSLGLNPMTTPFTYQNFQGKTVLYATKSCTEQLRSIHDISVTIVSRELTDGIYVVTSRAIKPNGRQDESIGALPLPGSAVEKANAMMKCETKAKRRVTLSICGLGFLDESELETIKGTPQYEQSFGGNPAAPARSQWGDSGSTQQAVEVAREKIAAAGGNPDVVEMPKPRAAKTKKASTVDEPKGWGDGKEKQFQTYKEFCKTIKGNLKHFTGSDELYYSILKDESCKNCTDTKDEEHGKRLMSRLSAASKSLKTASINRGEAADIRKQIGEAEYAHVLEQIEGCECPSCDGSGMESGQKLIDASDIANAVKCITCGGDGYSLDHVNADTMMRVLEALRNVTVAPQPNNPAITDSDLPHSIASAKPLTEHYKALMRCREQMVAKLRAGGKFGDLCGVEGFERMEDVTADAAKRIIQAAEDYMKDNIKPVEFMVQK